MGTQSLGVGVIGVNPDQGWARESHVPAVQAVDGLALVAVASRRESSAQEAAAAFGAARGYGDPEALIADPDVDIVGVAAPVPAHKDLILAALAAGKHVYCEWPLGVDVDETERIAKAAAEADGVRTAIGVQARTNPAVVAAARLIADGAIGRPLSASVLSTTAGFGPVIPENALYLEDPGAGMNLTTIQLMHTLDTAFRLLGPPTALAALLSTQFPDLRVGDDGRPEHRTLADHALVQATLGAGVPLAVEAAGGRPADDTPFRFEIVGEQATLELVGGSPRGFQAGTIALHVDGRPEPVDDAMVADLPATAVNVASNYAALRDDIVEGTRTAPDFEHARRLAHLLDDIRAADRDGRRLSSTQWPVG